MPGGRPSTYTPELGDKLCRQLSMGKSLRTACKDDDMPCIVTVYSWMRKYPEFLNQYARAKEDASDALVEDMLDIADEQSGDPARDRLRVDTRKWIASKLKPKRYGDKLALTDPDGGPLTVTINDPTRAGSRTPE